jgi:hypothetical protein
MFVAAAVMDMMNIYGVVRALKEGAPLRGSSRQFRVMFKWSLKNGG